MRKLTLLLCALLAGISLAVAQTSISGTVLSAENDEPVIGASILVKGANASTITDTDGKFTIKIPAGAFENFGYFLHRYGKTGGFCA